MWTSNDQWEKYYVPQKISQNKQKYIRREAIKEHVEHFFNFKIK
jgi:hypothetical protein